MRKILYFAYGSNMDIEQMKFRCPNALLIARATLYNYALCERQFADIEVNHKESVPGALWAISESDLQSLDRYEGFPQLYGREFVKVTTTLGRTYKALVYIMTPSTKRMRNGRKYSDYYRALCSDAADNLGIQNLFK